MASNTPLPEVADIVAKLHRLAPERIVEVEDFIDFLNHKDSTRSLAQTAAKTSEASFHSIWDNPDDAEYDKL